ncbi:alginate O-acetyltransferase complex protein AlgI [Caulobacter ginsengisoli]|uniref:Alginate O-acetyltransferase complex protein AlgI n=1 Tax=Caulobacter ginsengisoli TaxID=400775 RepID=A0ABU0IUQ8_9CAUL|nr:MBOAT family O-acyltransferase [Caulobacter ginsengisoli]MDQ0465753.1 alginate O-acetyltransferase complex protein AlgI [Caulobacter ginsengisoli]
MNEGLLLPAFAWLCAITALAWLVPARWQPLVVGLGGGGLLAWYAPASLAVLGAGTVVSFSVARLTRLRSVGVSLTIAGLAAAYAALLWGSRQASGLSLILPLGMAYYVLRTVHYLVEANLGRLRPHSLADYATYQFLPSALFFGPIHRFDEFQRDLARRRWDNAVFSRGLGRILAGAGKIVVIGNFILVERLGYSAQTDPLGGGALDIYRHGLLSWANLYFQFSGYSDIGIGFAALMGFRLRENFDWPFLARNIGDFWRRWHISLSTWCRDYVYAPAMARTRSHLLAITASMLVLGLWHAISLHYLLWGLYHALGLSIWRRFTALAPAMGRLPAPIRHTWTAFAVFLTLNFVVLSFTVTTLVERLIERI